MTRSGIELAALRTQGKHSTTEPPVIVSTDGFFYCQKQQYLGKKGEMTTQCHR